MEIKSLLHIKKTSIVKGIIHLGLPILICVYLQSCKECDDDPSITTLKVMEELQYNPGDKRVFSHLSTFDTFTFTFNNEYYMRQPGGRDAACPTYEDIQHLVYTFTNTSENPKIKYVYLADNPWVITELNAKKTTLSGNGLFSSPWPPVQKITVNSINYDSVGYLMVDTFNYIVYKPSVGILRIKTNSGTWDLVP